MRQRAHENTKTAPTPTSTALNPFGAGRDAASELSQRVACLRVCAQLATANCNKLRSYCSRAA
eukprot:7716584-Lingulodinium_polyedra.AAC.1